MTTSSRKLDHIRICQDRAVEADWRPFDDLVLVHRALPELDADRIDTTCQFLGRRLMAPIMITGMTGGHPDAKEINLNLAIAAQEMGVALGLGSQRAALEDSSLEETFSVVRDAAPDIPIVGNIGAVQLRNDGPEVLERLAGMIDADAIAIHLNFLQESIQPEGETDGSSVIAAITSAASGKVPIIVKETGAGISWEIASDLMRAGVRIVDVSGMGGTSWSGVEAYRADEHGDSESVDMGNLFWNWGIPTPVSVVECIHAGAEVVASGGVRSGVDVAKGIALGASMAGTALPMLGPATISSDEVARSLKAYIRALRISMFLTGSENIEVLKSAPIIIAGRSREYLESRGFDTRKFSILREMAR